MHCNDVISCDVKSIRNKKKDKKEKKRKKEDNFHE